MTLTELLREYGSITDKEVRHRYGAQYDAWLAPYRDTCRRVLEVGVSQFGGGSLLAWHAYFETATIIGADWTLDGISPAVTAADRIQLVKIPDAYQASAYSGPEFLEPFDLIVDDCVHTWTAQLSLFRLLRSRVRSGGLYVIEDSFEGLHDRERIAADLDAPCEMVVGPQQDSRLILVRL